MNKPRQRHWENRGQPGQLVFVTTKCLDWAPIFADPVLADEMVRLLFQIHQFYKAQLHAYVVMPEHTHFISRLPSDQTDRKFIGLLKSYSESQLHPRISNWQESRFDEQRGLNKRHFWARSFRSTVILTSTFFGQKLHYIHWNPVRRSLCSEPNEYKWTSARAFDEGRYEPETGLMQLWEDFDASTVPSVEAKKERTETLLASTAGAVEASGLGRIYDASTVPSVEAKKERTETLLASTDGAVEASYLEPACDASTVPSVEAKRERTGTLLASTDGAFEASHLELACDASTVPSVEAKKERTETLLASTAGAVEASAKKGIR